MRNKGIDAFIKENRKEFDVEMPSDQLWDRIDAALAKEKNSKRLTGLTLWLGVAASLLILMTVTFIYSKRKTDTDLDIVDINPAYAQKESHFASLIEVKKDSLQIYAKRNPELYAHFSADLNKLDGAYEKLKKELQNSPNQRAVVQAMVKNLELQLQVINQQLSIINDVNRYKEENQI